MEVSGCVNLLNEVNQQDANNCFSNFDFHVENHKLPYFTPGCAELYETRKCIKT